jgi:ribosome-associated translation inhibitor RaiA
MTNAVVALHFKDMEVPDALRTRIEERCQAMVNEFPELTHLELSVGPDGLGHEASAHATGKKTDAATHTSGDEPLQAADQVLNKLAHQLRREHDKRIFGHRRDARQHHPRRGEPLPDA